MASGKSAKEIMEKNISKENNSKPHLMLWLNVSEKKSITHFVSS